MSLKTTIYNPFWYLRSGYLKESDEEVDWYENEKSGWQAQPWQKWTEKRWKMEFGLIKPPVYRTDEGVKVDSQQLKESVDMVEIIGQFVELRKAGSRWVGKCCFHNEKTASLYVFPQTKSWHCFGCGEGSDIFDFIMKSQQWTFKEALDYLIAYAV